ncbi:ImmA/IrrE family metallo-endopeptidase [Shouchella clausii]|uniref:ImmA/IrrE family metallo-endopeptidase n=1 Tax=Shouchella clausii TaxID=79880 RepID=UPI00289BCE77|nr:ImmA/IrrE family metallo-endopeptidase [Shouchella clausii]
MIKIFTEEAVKSEVQEIVNHYKTHDVYKLCDYLQIKVLPSNLGKSKCLLQYYKAKPIFHVHQELKHKRFYVAYLLGHFFFNFAPEQMMAFNKIKKREASIFATELLLPDYILYPHLNTIKGKSAEEIANFFDLPTLAIRIKMKSVSDEKLHFIRH